MDRLGRWLIYDWLLLIALLKDLVIHRHICIDFIQKVWIELEFELIVFFLVLVLIRVVIRSSTGDVRGMMSCVNDVTLSELLFILVALFLDFMTVLLR